MYFRDYIWYACKWTSSSRIITTQITHGNLLNGGMFGIEGGILTTFVNLLSFIFVWYYYRDSKYDFVSDKVNVTNIKN